MAGCMAEVVLFSSAAEACSHFVARTIWRKSTHSSHALFLIVEEEKVGFIDRAGNVVITPRFDYAGNQTGDFLEGLARVRADGKWGFIDVTGEWVIRPHFLYAYDFSEGLATAQNGGGRLLHGLH